MSFNTDWDIDKYRDDHESEEHWLLRRNFIQRWKNDYDEDRLLCLARVFVNVELMGCRYPEKVMLEIAQLSKEVNRINIARENSSFDNRQSKPQVSNGSAFSTNPRESMEQPTDVTSDENQNSPSEYVWAPYSREVMQAHISISKVLRTTPSKNFIRENLSAQNSGADDTGRVPKTDVQAQSSLSQFIDTTRVPVSEQMLSRSWEPNTNFKGSFKSEPECDQHGGIQIIQATKWQSEKDPQAQQTNTENINSTKILSGAKIEAVEDQTESNFDNAKPDPSGSNLDDIVDEEELWTNFDNSVYNPQETGIDDYNNDPQGNQPQNLPTSVGHYTPGSANLPTFGALPPSSTDVEIVIELERVYQQNNPYRKKKLVIKKSSDFLIKRYNFWINAGKTPQEADNLSRLSLRVVKEFNIIKDAYKSSCRYNNISEKKPATLSYQARNISKECDNSSDKKSPAISATSSNTGADAGDIGAPVSNIAGVINIREMSKINEDGDEKGIKLKSLAKIKYRYWLNVGKSPREAKELAQMRMSKIPEYKELRATMGTIKSYRKQCAKEKRKTLKASKLNEANINSYSSSRKCYRNFSEFHEVTLDGDINKITDATVNDISTSICNSTAGINTVTVASTNSTVASNIGTLNDNSSQLMKMKESDAIIISDHEADFAGGNIARNNNSDPHLNTAQIGYSDSKKNKTTKSDYEIYVKDANNGMTKVNHLEAFKKSIEECISGNDEIKILGVNKYKKCAVVVCANEYSRDWLDKEIPTLVPWEGAELIIVAKLDILTWFHAWIYVPIVPKTGSILNPNDLLQKLHEHNPKVGCVKWKVLSSKREGECQILFVRFPLESDKVMRCQGYNLKWFGGRRLKLKVKENEPPKTTNIVNNPFSNKKLTNKQNNMVKNLPKNKNFANNLTTKNNLANKPNTTNNWANNPKKNSRRNRNAKHNDYFGQQYSGNGQLHSGGQGSRDDYSRQNINFGEQYSGENRYYGDQGQQYSGDHGQGYQEHRGFDARGHFNDVNDYGRDRFRSAHSKESFTFNEGGSGANYYQNQPMNTTTPGKVGGRKRKKKNKQSGF